MTDPLSYRLHRWLYGQEPRLAGDTDPRALGEAIGALGVNAGALLGRALVAEGEEAFEATLKEPVWREYISEDEQA